MQVLLGVNNEFVIIVIPLVLVQCCKPNYESGLKMNSVDTQLTSKSELGHSKRPSKGVVWRHFVARLRLCLSPVRLETNGTVAKETDELKVNRPCRKLSRFFCQLHSVVGCRLGGDCRLYPLGRPLRNHNLAAYREFKLWNGLACS